VTKLISLRSRKPTAIRKFVEVPGGRRVGDRIAYVVDAELLANQAGPLSHWQEDRSFDERTALREGPGLQQVLNVARRDGIALCIKG
jgi:hypothetical protein